MKKLMLLLLIVTALAYSASAAPSYTNVTVTLQDTSTQVWKSASWQTIFVPPFGNPGQPNNDGTAIMPNQSGVADASGVFTVTLDDNLAVAPSGTKWRFVICPNATVASCTTIETQVTGGSEDLSSVINPQLIVPNVMANPTIYRSYQDGQTTGGFGALYLNTVDNSLRECVSFFCFGSGWVVVTVPTTNPVFIGTVTANCFKAVFDASNDATICPQAATGHINLTLPAVTGTFALLDSPNFSGIPTAPTAAPGTNTQQIATTAFVTAAIGTAPVTSVFGRTGAVVAVSGDYSVGQVTGAAPLASPTFTGVPAAPTNGSPTDNTTQLATDAFVQSALGSGTANPGAVTGKVVSLTTNTGTAIGASATTWITKATVMPSSGCPCRILVSYSAMYTSGGSGAANFWVSDGTNVFATSQVLTNTAGSDAAGASASSISPVTYANGATVTLLGRGFTSAGGGISVASASVGGSSQASWLSVVVITSN